MSAATVTSASSEEPAIAFLNDICQAARLAAKNPLEFPKLHDAVMQLEKFIFSLDGDDEKAKALLQDLSPDLVSSLNDACCFWETQLEYQFALDLLDGKRELPAYGLYDRHQRLVKQELELLSSSRPKRMLFV